MVYPFNLLYDINPILADRIQPADINSTIEYFVQRLDTTSRNILMKHYKENIPCNSIAAAVNLPTYTVDNMRKRSVETLKENEEVFKFGLSGYIDMLQKKRNRAIIKNAILKNEAIPAFANKLDNIDLPIRLRTILKKHNVRNINELRQAPLYTILSSKQVGKKTVEETLSAFNEIGLKLR